MNESELPNGKLLNLYDGVTISKCQFKYLVFEMTPGTEFIWNPIPKQLNDNYSGLIFVQWDSACLQKL